MTNFCPCFHLDTYTFSFTPGCHLVLLCLLLQFSFSSSKPGAGATRGWSPATLFVVLELGNPPREDLLCNWQQRLSKGKPLIL